MRKATLMKLGRHIAVIMTLLFTPTLWSQVERVLPIRGSSSLEGTSFVVGFMQNEVVEIDEPPRLQIFISAQFDATVTITSPIAGTYTRTVRANTVHVETLRSDHVISTSEQIQRKAVFVTSDVPIVVYALNTLAQSTDSYTAIPIQHLGTAYRTVNRPTDRYNGPQFFNQLPRVGEFLVIAVDDNTVVNIDTPVPTARRQRAISTTLRKGDCYLVQAQATANGADDLTGSYVRSSKPVALLSGHVRSSIPSLTTNSKDHLVEQLPPVDKWGKSYATAPMLLKSAVQRPDVYRVVASKPDQTIQIEFLNRTVSWTSVPGREWLDTAFREPAYWTSQDPFMLVQCMPSGGSSPVNYDPAMVVVPPVEQFVTSALFQFPKLEINDNVVDQKFYYFLNVVATPEALQSLRVDATPVRAIDAAILTQKVAGTNLHWVQLELAEGSHVMACDSGLFTAIMYGTSFADSYANMVGVAYEPQRKRDISPPAYALSIDCGAINGEIRDISSDTAKLRDVYVVAAQTRNYRWALTPVADSEHVMLFEAVVQDPYRDGQIVLHAYDDRGNGREWKYVYDAPNLAYAKSITIDRIGTAAACTTVVVRNVDTSATRVSSVYIVGDSRVSIEPAVVDTLLAAGDSLVFRVCAAPSQDSSTINAVIRVQLPCSYRTIAVSARAGGMITGGDVDFGDVRIGDSVCAPVAIVNSGAKAVVLTIAKLQQLAGGLRIDTTGLYLPRTMAQGDQVWVKMCFVPGDTGVVTRTDTVVSRDAGFALLTGRGRGVRPIISSIVVDWGRRRLGSLNDTTVYLINRGSCGARTSARVTMFRGPFASLQQDIQNVSIAAPDSIPIALRFAPVSRGGSADTQAVSVDWRYHEPVDIILKGIGVLPDVVFRDIDMGTVKLGNQRDTLATLISPGGASNAPLIIDSVRVLGPDQSAFRLPAGFLGLASENVVSEIIDSIRFTPQRPGMHTCALEVMHNAAIDIPARDTFYIIGEGIPKDSAELQFDIAIDGPITRCVPSAARIVLANSGTADAPIRIVYAVVDGKDTSILVTEKDSLRLLPAQQQSYTVRVSTSPDRACRLELHVVDSAGNVYTIEKIVAVVKPEAELSHGWDTIPNSRMVQLETGQHELLISCAVPDRVELLNPIELAVVIPKTRFSVDQGLSSAFVVREAGQETRRPIRFALKQSDSDVSVEITDSLTAPWELLLRLPGTVLWKNDSSFTSSAVMRTTPCIDDVVSQPVDITTVPCGSRIREIALGVLPRVAVRPLKHPFQDEAVIEVTSNDELAVSVTIETLSGEQFCVFERLTLQKGIQHCNFSCSRWSRGVYALVIHRGEQVLDRKIIIVN
ncbi:MAG: choice-of-anchor D domain-containing protein [Ignavibacteria bacterium]|nr:choice-of-anchor D domain-containing protein [Ignavibacteria bacterium]